MEYSTALGPYFTTYDVKVQFFIQYFPSIKIKLHLLQVDNNEGESGIGYDMIIVCDLMVQLGLLDNLRCQVLQWDGATVPIK